ncbi:malate dehydrogenase, cytoplasmic isoform X2 [Athalia rosae]|uniref:malate dehydrogenase, cytoplasmic isoform X2 n=1 Tax=Athalia rosae TaxID=37344 RepID=UPI00203353C8|nr:malate dehydrogenase, cytoplasmic isoform X2 [Athalia rosae]
MAEPINVVVTGAAGQIAYSLLYQLAAGSVFGPEQPINLRLLDIPPMMDVLQGVVMELEDLALSLLREVTPTADPAVAFKDAAAAFLVGAMPRKQGMERKDLLAANVKIFKVQGEALDKFARKDIKVLVVGNPANTNALICSHYAPSIPKENFTAMTRLDQNRAQAALAARLSVPVDKVENVIIWGNHSSTQFADASHAVATLPSGAKPVPAAINDNAWLNGEFLEKIQKRGAAVIAARKMSSAMSAAKAAGDHMKDWWIGTQPGKWVSMGVVSDGSYGIPRDIVFSFPVTVENHQFKIVQGLSISDFARSKLNITAKELEEERTEANSVLEQ